jgi:hypothetical protein
MRERAAQSLNPEMGRLGAEDPSTAFSAASPGLACNLGPVPAVLPTTSRILSAFQEF